MQEHNHDDHSMNQAEVKAESYTPLFLVLGGIILGVAVWEIIAGRFEIFESMRIFMGLFFLTFGFFKTLDWKGFIDAFAEYDIVAARSRIYATIYPGLEIALGVLFLINFNPVLISAITVIIMGVSSIGVIRAVMSKKPFRCACLGTVVKLPMSTITIIEDVGMGLMALVMLIKNLV